MKNTGTLIIIAVILVGGSFYGGMQYGKGQAPATTAGARFAGMTGGPRGARGLAGGGFTGGQIISKDATTLTVGVQGSGSKIVLYTDSTPVMKTVSGTIGDLNIGENITVTGAANPDGSISASAIQIRPATTTRAQ